MVKVFVNVDTAGNIVECIAGSYIVPDKDYHFSFELEESELTDGHTADVIHDLYKVENGELIRK